MGLHLRSWMPKTAHGWAAAFAPLIALAGGLAVFAFVMIVTVRHYYGIVPANAPEATFKAELDRDAPGILRHFNVPGAVIVTVLHGAPAQTYAYGYADVQQGEPMTADTVFRVASISKSLTAWGVLRLVQTGKLELDAPAARYLGHLPLGPSSFPTSGITIRRLLNHTSGLNNGADSFRDPDEPQPSTLDLLERQGPGPAANPGPPRLIAQPGADFLYSVPGYTLLQLIVERQTGQLFADYMQSEVLTPLGMHSSSFRWDPALRRRTATPYGADGNPVPIRTADDSAADSLFASAADIATFVAAPLPDKALPAGAGVLHPDLIGNLYDEPTQLPNLQLSSIGTDTPGLGCFIEQTPGHPVVVTNVGLDPGWASQYFISPATGDGIVILTNSDAGPPAIAQITSIWSSWRGLPLSNLTAVYRKIGSVASICVSVLAALDITFASSLLIELWAGRRRLAAISLATVAGGALELVLAVAAGTLLIVAQPLISTLSMLDRIAMVEVALLAALVVARTVAPAPRIAKPSRRGVGASVAQTSP